MANHSRPGAQSVTVGSVLPLNFAGEKPKTGRESPDIQIFPEEVRVEPGLSFHL